MSRASLLILIGVLIALSPFSGLPMAWLSFALPVLGLLTLAIGISFRPKKSAPTNPSHEASVPASS